MWDDDEKNETGDVVATAQVDAPPDYEQGKEQLMAFFEELDTVTFLASAADQVGDKFRFGAEVRMSDKDPDAFDCSELVEWSAHQAGVKMPDGSWNQFKHINRAGTTTSVEEALDTPGALLFRFGSDPLSTKGRPAGAHVAISLGDGRVIEATTGGVRIVERTEGWTHAGVIPGLEVADDSPIWADRPTGDTVGEDPPFGAGADAAPPGGEVDAPVPGDEPDAAPADAGATSSQAPAPEPAGEEHDPGWDVVPHGGPPSKDQLDANRYLVEGASRPATAPPNAIFDDGDLERIGRALAEGRSVAMASNGHLYIGRRGEYDPMTEQAEEFVESRLGEMRKMVEAGVSIGIRPDGTFSGNRSDGRLKIFGGPDAAIDQQELTLITEYLKSGSRVQVHADGMIELRDVPGDPEPSFEEGQRLAREFLRLHDSGDLARQMAEGNMLTISHDTVEFTPSPAVAPAGDLDVPRESPGQHDDGAVAADDGEAPPTGSPLNPPPAVPTATDAPSEDAPSAGTVPEVADHQSDEIRELELRTQAEHARRFEVALDRAADSHRSIRDEYKLERLRLDLRAEALADQAKEATQDLTRWDADLKRADDEIARISEKIAELEAQPGTAAEVSKLVDLEKIARGERDELLDLRRPEVARLKAIDEQRAELLVEAKGFDEQIVAHTRMYESMRSVSESAERFSAQLRDDARAVGRPGEQRPGETDPASSIHGKADRAYDFAELASRAADASAAHAARLAIRIDTLENRVDAERAREAQAAINVTRMRQELKETDDLAAALKQRGIEAREAGRSDEADIYERRALRAEARSAEVKSSMRLSEQEGAPGGYLSEALTTSEAAANLYQRQLTRLKDELVSVKAEVVELRELATLHAEEAEMLDLVGSGVFEPRAAGGDDDPDIDVISGEAPVEPGEDLAGDADAENVGPEDEVDHDADSDDLEGAATAEIQQEPEHAEASPLQELEDSLESLTGDVGVADVADGADDPLLDPPDTAVDDAMNDFTAEPQPLADTGVDADPPDEGFDDPL